MLDEAGGDKRGAELRQVERRGCSYWHSARKAITAWGRAVSDGGGMPGTS